MALEGIIGSIDFSQATISGNTFTFKEPVIDSFKSAILVLLNESSSATDYTFLVSRIQETATGYIAYIFYSSAETGRTYRCDFEAPNVIVRGTA